MVVGALLEGLPALLIFGPILFPIGRSIGVDPVHYGIVVIAAMGIAFFLPPVGVGLTIAAGIARVTSTRSAALMCRIWSHSSSVSHLSRRFLLSRSSFQSCCSGINRSSLFAVRCSRFPP